MLYLVGEPLKIGLARKPDCFYAPAGQLDLCREVLRESMDWNMAATKMQAEYLAIVLALRDMGVHFKIVYAHPEKIDQIVLGVCVNRLGCRLMGFPEGFFPASVAYPRDFCTVLPNLLLLSSNATARLNAKEKNGWRLRISPYGEGGRALVQGGTMIGCEKAVLTDGKSTPCDREAEELRRLGIKVGFFPSTLSTEFSGPNEGGEKVFSNDHIDRVACMLRGKDGKLSLVVDPMVYTANWSMPAFLKPWTVCDPEETRDHLCRNLGPMGIKIRWPEKLSVPYALNLVQFADGRVLMTAGDPCVKALVESIVGEGNVFETAIPIRYFPVWARAGIRCLVSEAPMPIIINNPK